MRLLRSLLFAAIFYPGTIVFCVIGMIASLGGGVTTRSVVHAWARFHQRLCDTLLGVQSRMVGNIPPGPHLIAVKHQSMYETIETMRIADTPVVVMKRQLVDMPFFGWMTRRYGVIPVDREAGAAALREMLKLGKAAAGLGRPIIIFPEGTRVPPGEQPPLRAGFAGLYRAIGLPVVPIAMDSGRLWGRGLVKQAGTVTFLVGETIPAGLKRDEIEARVHAAINALDSSAS